MSQRSPWSDGGSGHEETEMADQIAGPREPPAVRVLRVHRRDELRIEPVPAPVARDDQAVVRVRYGGICGSDVHYWRDGAVGNSILRGRMTLGHEVVGTIARPARDGSGPVAGQLVAIHPAEVCGTCRWCRAGETNLCVACRYLGRVDGGQVLVVGGGPIGLLIMAVAAHRGAASTTVIDVHERPLQTARRIGATHVLDATQLASRGEDTLEADIASESPLGLVVASAALDPLITDVLPLDEALRAFELAADPSRSTKVLLDFGGDEATGSTRAGGRAR